jgi:branched-chain amino acid transport system substrate-binding protein
MSTVKFNHFFKEGIFMKTKRNYISAPIILLFLVPFLLFSLASCQKQKVKEKPIIKIGALLPLTGPLGNRGQQEKEAIELAINDFNSNNSEVIMAVIFEDSYGRPYKDRANKLLESDKVSAILASTSPVSRSIYPLANEKKIIMAFLCSDPTIQKESPYIFRLYESKESEAEQISKYYGMADKKIIVLYLDQPEITNQLTSYLMPAFRQNKSKILFYEPLATGQKYFKETIDRANNSGANSILLLGSGDELRSILEEIGRQNLIEKTEVVGGIGLLSFNESATILPDGVIVAVPQYLIDKNEKAKAFEEKFLKTYDHNPNIHAAFAYDAVQILSEGLGYGLNKGQGSAETVAFHVTNRKYQGIMGEVHVDNMGALVVPMEVGVIEKGKILPLTVREIKASGIKSIAR